MGPPKKQLNPSSLDESVKAHVSHRDSLLVEETKGGGGEEERPAKRPRLETADPPADPESDVRCAMLIDMGMDPALSAKAAAHFTDVEQAVEWILDGAPALEAAAAPPVGAAEGTRVDVEIKVPDGFSVKALGQHVAREPQQEPAEDASSGFSFLTYNVWFMDGEYAPNVAVDARMAALAKIIQERKPDVVALQECTAKIVRLLQGNMALQQAYAWSPMPRGCPYFTMMLSRRSQSFQRLAFPMSQMGRDLLLTEAKVGFGQRVHVATSHLESAVPPYNGEALMSKQRAQQMQTAGELFTQQGVRNAVYGGDMNWDETKKDGDPLKILNEGGSGGEDWQDLWQLLQAGDPGFTYDGKRNDMLLNHMKMRLDRVFVRLKDYAPLSIEMVGTSKIPGETFEKETKRGSRTLPLMVSDHFGLFCQFERKAGGEGHSLR